MTAPPPPSQQPPPPEGDVIRIARNARGLSLADTAARVAELFGGRLSASRLSQIETGDQKKGGDALEVRAGDARLAHIAYIVGTSPDQLVQAGRPESAKILREILRQRGETDALLREIMEMEDESVPLEDRRNFLDLARKLRARNEGGGESRDESA